MAVTGPDKLQKITLLTEMIGGVAVLLTLIILIVEVRENTEASRRANLIQLTTAPLNAYLDNPDVQAISSKIADGAEGSRLPTELQDEFGLTHEEAHLYARYLGYTWRIRESEYLFGNSEPAVFRQNMIFYLNNPEDKVYWEYGQAPYHPEFRAYIDGILQELE